jgi:hypothetical protein
LPTIHAAVSGHKSRRSTNQLEKRKDSFLQPYCKRGAEQRFFGVGKRNFTRESVNQLYLRRLFTDFALIAICFKPYELAFRSAFIERLTSQFW